VWVLEARVGFGSFQQLEIKELMCNRVYFKRTSKVRWSSVQSSSSRMVLWGGYLKKIGFFLRTMVNIFEPVLWVFRTMFVKPENHPHNRWGGGRLSIPISNNHPAPISRCVVAVWYRKWHPNPPPSPRRLLVRWIEIFNKWELLEIVNWITYPHNTGI
jgi:hypothetical protein